MACPCKLGFADLNDKELEDRGDVGSSAKARGCCLLLWCHVAEAVHPWSACRHLQTDGSKARGPVQSEGRIVLRLRYDHAWNVGWGV